LNCNCYKTSHLSEVYICIYLYVYIHIYIRIYTHICISSGVYMKAVAMHNGDLQMPRRGMSKFVLFVYKYLNIYIYVCINICIYIIETYKCLEEVYVYINIYIYIYIYTYIYIYVYI
jgi:hypothetical protein